jgi:hypothetical protein
LASISTFATSPNWLGVSNQSVNRPVPRFPELPADDDALHFGSALPDAVDAHVAVQALDRVLLM